VQALAEAGIFRLRGVLVGTVAYQCYPAMTSVQGNPKYRWMQRQVEQSLFS
jgi:hypothetical protein